MIYIKHELTDPPASASGEVKLYGLADNELYWMDSTGKRHKVSGGGASVLPDGTDSRQVLKWNNVTATWQAQVLAYSDLSGNLNSAYITTNTDQTGLSGSKETIGTWTFDASAKSLASETVFKVKKDASTNWLRMRGDGTLAMAKAEVDNLDASNIQVADSLDVYGLSRFNTNGADYGASINVGHGATSAGWIITQLGGWEFAGLYVLGGTHNGKPYYTYSTHYLFIAQVGASWFWFIHDELIANGNTAYTTATARQLIGGTNSDYLPSASSFYIQNGAYTGQNASASYEEGSNLGISTNSIQVREGSGAGKILLSDASGKGSWNDPSVFNSNFITTSTAQSGLTGDKSTSGVWSFLGGISFPTNQGITNSGTMPYSATTHKWDSGISGSTAKYQFGGGDVEASGGLCLSGAISGTGINLKLPSGGWIGTGANPNSELAIYHYASEYKIKIGNVPRLWMYNGNTAIYSNDIGSGSSGLALSYNMAYTSANNHLWDSGISGSTAKYQFGGGNAEFSADVTSATIDARNGMKISGNWADGNTITINKATGRIRNLWGGGLFGPSLDWDGPNFYVTGTFGQKLGMEGSAGLTYRDSAGNVQFKLRDVTTSGITTLGSIEVVSSAAAVSLSASSLLSLNSSASINYNATTKHFWDSGISGSTAKYQFNGQVHGLSYGMTNALSALTPATDTSSRIQAGVQDNTVSSLSDGGTKARVIHVQAGASGDGYSHQLGLTDNGNMWMRSGASGGTTWGTWKKVWSENNFDPSTKANLSGASFSDTIAIRGTRDSNVGVVAYGGYSWQGAYRSTVDGTAGKTWTWGVYGTGADWQLNSEGVGNAIMVNKTTLATSLSGALSGTSASFTGQVSTSKAFVSGSNGLSTTTGATANVDISAYGVWYHTAQLTGAVTLNMNAGAQAGLEVKVWLTMPATAVSYTLAYNGVWFALGGSATSSGNSITIPSTKFVNGGYHCLLLTFVAANTCHISII